MLSVVLITLSLFGGGTVDVDKNSIEYVQEGDCRTSNGHYGFFENPTITHTPCRYVNLKSRETLYVSDTREEILRKMK